MKSIDRGLSGLVARIQLTFETYSYRWRFHVRPYRFLADQYAGEKKNSSHASLKISFLIPYTEKVSTSNGTLIYLVLPCRYFATAAFVTAG